MFSIAEDATSIMDRNGLEITVRCGRCRGSGKGDLVRKEGQCRICKGTGSHNVTIDSQSSIIISCGYCKGSGTQYRDGQDPLCPTCRGLGVGELNHPAYKCNVCGGKGHQDESDNPCPTCRGWGALSD